MARSRQGTALLVILGLLALAAGLVCSGALRGSGAGELTVSAAEAHGAPVDADWHPEPNGVAAVEAPAGRDARALAPEPPAQPPVELDLRVSLETLARLGHAHDADDVAEPRDPRAQPGRESAVIDLFRDSVPATAGNIAIVAGPTAGASFAADAQGRVFLTALRPGRHLIRVSVEDKAPFLRFLRIQPGQRASSAIAWRPGAALEGRVTEPGGKPIPKALVAVDGTEIHTDESGHYLLGGLVSGEDAVVRVSAPGCVPCERPVDLHRGVTAQFHFQLQPAARVKGRVIMRGRRTGQPARVFVLPGPGVASAEERSIPFHLPQFAGRLTDADGAFELDGLPVGSVVRILARTELCPASKPQTLRLREVGLQRRTVILDPVPGSVVYGTVRDREGQPVPGARISCWPEESSADAFDEARRELYLSTETLLAHVLPAELLRLHATETTADAEGAFLLGRPRTRKPCHLLVSQRGFLSSEITLGEGEGPSGEQNITLLAAPQGSAHAGNPAALVLQFTGPQARNAALRVTVSRDGIQESLAFRWNPAQPLSLPLPGAAHVALSASFHRAGHQLATLLRRELTVQGTVAVKVPLP